MIPTQPQGEPVRAIAARRHPNHGRPRPRPMTLKEVARAFVYYQTHTQRETAAMFGVAQSTVGAAFRRVFGDEAVRDAEATWRIKRDSPRTQSS
jgi:hypothetical protein